jgi:hypothetical protein
VDEQTTILRLRREIEELKYKLSQMQGDPRRALSPISPAVTPAVIPDHEPMSDGLTDDEIGARAEESAELEARIGRLTKLILSSSAVVRDLWFTPSGRRPLILWLTGR